MPVLTLSAILQAEVPVLHPSEYVNAKYGLWSSVESECVVEPKKTPCGPCSG